MVSSARTPVPRPHRDPRTDYWREVAVLLGMFALLALANLAGRIWDQFLPSGQLQPIYAQRPWVFWVPWVLAIPVVVWATRGWCSPAGWRATSLSRRFVTPAALLVGAFFARVGLCALTDDRPTEPTALIEENLALVPLDLVALVGLSATAVGVNRYRWFRARAVQSAALSLRTARLESELARAQLAAYRGQLDPHFLFNSLNAVATLVRQARNDTAVTTLAELSALLRLAAESVGQAEVPLRTEMDFIQRYLAIESLRFGQKLRVERAVPEELLDLLVPNLLLQPLVENAIKHGISRRIRPGRIRLSGIVEAGRLVLRVANDPSDDPAAAVARADRPGLGLANVRARLHYLYDAAAELTLRTAPADLTVVEVRLPARMGPRVAGLADTTKDLFP